MGRWVTSKGRRIYIPDEGEENPYAKKHDDNAIKYIMKREDVGYEVAKDTYEHMSESEKKHIAYEAYLKQKQSGYSREEAEQQMADRYKQGEHDTVMMEKDGRYQVAKNRKEADYAEKNGWKTTEMKSEDYQRIKSKASIDKEESTKQKQIATNKKQADERNGKSKKESLSPMAKVQQMTESQLRSYVKKNGLTKNYNMMMNTRSGGYDYQKQIRVMKDLVADHIAVKEARKKKRSK